MTSRRSARQIVHEPGTMTADVANPDPTGAPDAPTIPVARRHGFHGVVKWVVWFSVWITASLAALLFVDAVERLTAGDEDE